MLSFCHLFAFRANIKVFLVTGRSVTPVTFCENAVTFCENAVTLI